MLSGPNKGFPLVSKLVFFSICTFYTLLAIGFWEYEPVFDFVHTNISRLGRPSRNPDGYLFTNAAFFLSGILMLFLYRNFGDWKIPDHYRANRAIYILQRMGYISCLCLMGLAIANSDYRIPHKAFGGIYFGADMMIMCLGAYVVYQHPKLHNALIPVLLASAVLDGVFLMSAGKMSWAEWGTVSLSFLAAGWVAVCWKRLGEVVPETEKAWNRRLIEK